MGKKAIIIGGGIGGLTLASTLRKIGWTALVFEKSTTGIQRSHDVGLGIWSNARRCLESLGIAEPLEAGGRYMTNSGYMNPHGEILATPSRPLNKGDLLFIRESELLNALTSILPPESIQTGKEFQEWKRLSNGNAELTLKDGTKEEGDIIIGCDGIFSKYAIFP